MTMVTMLENRKGSEDGFTVKQFYRGETYEIHEALARSFFAAGFAVKQEKQMPKKKRISSKRMVKHKRT